MRIGKTTTALAGALACLVAGASVALAAGSSSKPAGGPVQLLVQPGNGQGGGKIIFTGAVGDYGTSSPLSAGTTKYGVATLTKGTIKINLTAIAAKVDSANPTPNIATCSASITESAAAPVVSGTGLYAGIHGSIEITESFAFIGATYKTGAKKGQCNMSNSAPTVAEMGAVYGTGSVSFS